MYTLEVSFDDGITFTEYDNDQETTARVTNVSINGVDLINHPETLDDVFNLNSRLSVLAYERGAALVDVFVNAVNDNILTWEQVEVIEHVQGPYNRDEDFAEELACESGDMAHVPDYVLGSIDWGSVWDNNLRHDYYTIDGNDWDYYYIHVGKL